MERLEPPELNDAAKGRVGSERFSSELIDLDEGVYSIILSYTDDSVDNFCVMFGCTHIFWTELIRNRFFKYYVPTAKGYSWRELYYDLLWYEDALIKVDWYEDIHFSSKYNQYDLCSDLNKRSHLKTYLIKEVIMKLDL